MKKVSCPICQRVMEGERPKEWPDWPFCSSRCKLIDLGRWLGEAYRFTAHVQPEDLEECEDSVQSPKPAVPSADPHREEA